MDRTEVRPTARAATRVCRGYSCSFGHSVLAGHWSCGTNFAVDLLHLAQHSLALCHAVKSENRIVHHVAPRELCYFFNHGGGPLGFEKTNQIIQGAAETGHAFGRPHLSACGLEQLGC